MDIINTILLLLLIASVVGVGLILRNRKPEDDTGSILLLQTQLENLRDQLGRSFSESTKIVNEQLAQMTNQVGARLETQNQTLNETQKHLGERMDNAARVVAGVQGKLGQLEEASNKIYELGKSVNSLHEILKAPKLRGNLGEFFLSELLAQIFNKDQYELQYRFQSGEVVDAIIKLSNWLVPVDAKFPLENFVKYLQEEQEQNKRNLRKLFVNDVKKHIDKIAEKYLRPDEGTSDFALMYIPAENVYYEIIIKDDMGEGEHVLYNHAIKKKVIPVSPNNFYIYLQTILMGLKGMSIELRAKEIMASLSTLKLEFGKVAEAHRKVGVHLQNAKSAHDDMANRLGHFQNKMDKMQQLQSDKALIANDDDDNPVLLN